MSLPPSSEPRNYQDSFDALLFEEEKPASPTGTHTASVTEAPSPECVVSAVVAPLPAPLPASPSPAPWTGESLHDAAHNAAKEEQKAVTTRTDRADRADVARQKVDEGIAALAVALEAGNSDALTAYLTTLSRFHRYSLGNILLIAFQNPEATHVAGFTTWRSMGRNVIKGEKGMMILAPIPKRFKGAGEGTDSSGEDEPADTMGKTGKAMRSGVWGFKVVYVFDISQTEGKEFPQFAQVKGDPAENLDRLKTLVGEEGIGLSYSDQLGGAYGISLKGHIEIREGLTPAHEFSVLVHELAHELLHKDTTRRAETDKTVRETEAEAVAFVVCQAIGLDTSSQHADYIKLYRGSAETLTASLTAIQETATRILSTIAEKNNETGRAAENSTRARSLKS